ncbi:MAG: hypothetical protein HY876_00805 [Coriobacteriales bacterium]|nr:hypothetical protein [Coriobacteriales bacterium]
MRTPATAQPTRARTRLLRIESVTVTPHAVIARVLSAPDALRTSVSPGFAERALALLPGLKRHRCDNGSAHGIVGELDDTETPHALEHVAFELMALSGSPRNLKGRTAWDFARDGRGAFEVALEYDVDLVALGALKAGVVIVEWLVAPAGQAPDIEAVVEGLCATRSAALG